MEKLRYDSNPSSAEIESNRRILFILSLFNVASNATAFS